LKEQLAIAFTVATVTAAARPAPRRVASPHPAPATRYAALRDGCAPRAVMCVIPLLGGGAFPPTPPSAANVRSAHWLAAASPTPPSKAL